MTLPMIVFFSLHTFMTNINENHEKKKPLKLEAGNEFGE
jgi:hypothetical protein